MSADQFPSPPLGARLGDWELPAADARVTLPDGSSFVGCRAFQRGTPQSEAYPDARAKPALQQQVGGGHYKGLAIQPVEYCQRNNLGFCESSVVKYVTRWKDKAGVEDLRKARHFLDLLIEMTEEDVKKANTYCSHVKSDHDSVINSEQPEYDG